MGNRRRVNMRATGARLAGVVLLVGAVGTGAWFLGSWFLGATAPTVAFLNRVPALGWVAVAVFFGLMAVSGSLDKVAGSMDKAGADIADAIRRPDTAAERLGYGKRGG